MRITFLLENLNGDLRVDVLISNDDIIICTSVAGEQDRETSDSIKSGEFFGQLRDCWLFKVKHAH
jgi:hypothetical protein